MGEGADNTAWGRLRQRKLAQWALAYAAVAWIALQAVGFVAGVYDWPPQVLRVLTGIAFVGFAVVLVLAWYHGERGQQKASNIEVLILAFVVGAGAGALWLVERNAVREAAPRPVAVATTPDEARPAQPPPSPKSIAVLPFVNMSGDAENEFFSDGVSEEILNSLARIEGMQVVGRTSSFQFKGRNEDLREVGNKLGVANLLEGSVRRSGEKARIKAQLIRASDGIHLWSQTYDRTLEDTLAVQLDIAEHVAGALDVVLDDRQRNSMRDAGVKNVEAFIAYQKGLRLFDEAHDPSKSMDLLATLKRANADFDRATQIEPGLAMAHFLSADMHEHVVLSDTPTLEEKKLALRAIHAELDAALRGTLAPQQRLFIEVDRQILSDDWRGVVPRVEAALAATGCGETVWLLQFAEAFGYGAQVQALADRQIRCDPLDVSNHVRRAEGANWAGDPEQALVLVAESESMLGNSPLTVTGQRVRSLVALGRIDEARAAMATMDAGDLITNIVALTVARAGGAGPEELRKAVLTTDKGNKRLDTWSLHGLMAAALLEDRADANRRAAEMDARPAGPLLLAIVVQYCHCGAPFELDATPNFKARIAEAGLPWPPSHSLVAPLQQSTTGAQP